MRPLLLLLLFTILGCASNHSLTLTPASEVAEALNRGINVLNQFYNDTNQANFYAVIRNDVQTQIILCKGTDTPATFKNVLKKSGRFIVLNGHNIPFFYYFDTESDLMKKEYAGQWMIGGYSIVFDFHNHVIQEGMQF